MKLSVVQKVSAMLLAVSHLASTINATRLDFRPESRHKAAPAGEK